MKLTHVFILRFNLFPQTIRNVTGPGPLKAEPKRKAPARKKVVPVKIVSPIMTRAARRAKELAEAAAREANSYR